MGNGLVTGKYRYLFLLNWIEFPKLKIWRRSLEENASFYVIQKFL